MGVDLVLMPVHSSSAHTILWLNRNSLLWDHVRELSSRPVPLDLYGYFGPPGEDGEHQYGAMTHDAYDEELRMVRASLLAGTPEVLWDQVGNEPDYAYIKAMDADDYICLYWC